MVIQIDRVLYIILVSTTCVKLRDAIKFKQYKDSDDLSIFCLHQYSIFQMYMRKLP